MQKTRKMKLKAGNLKRYKNKLCREKSLKGLRVITAG